ncbi:MAG TPA: prepilin peptidase [Candidatus Bathyarchaeia archaeon]|nr:prepilin peptidase [Candidatus Bathyarchaeia archaeon]
MGIILPVLFLIGLVFGSFLNCLVYRLNHGLSPLGGRSFCPKCKHKLSWKDNLPLVSFVLLRGRCRYCRSPISWQYPLVELGTAIVTLLTVSFLLRAGQPNLVVVGFWLLVTYGLLVVFVSDFLYSTIPDEVVFSLVGLACLYFLFFQPFLVVPNLFSGLGAAGFFWALMAVTGGKGMGMGDVKLAGLMGLILGWPGIVIALYLAFLTGALVGVILILTGRKRFGQHLPFGPFLATATWITIFWGDKISSWVQTWL